MVKGRKTRTRTESSEDGLDQVKKDLRRTGSNGLSEEGLDHKEGPDRVKKDWIEREVDLVEQRKIRLRSSEEKIRHCIATY